MQKMRFCLNKELDKQMVSQFLDERGGGIDYGKEIISLHPALRSAINQGAVQRKKTIHAYVDRYYRLHRTEMQDKAHTLGQFWHKKEEDYVVITQKFFGGFKFPPGEYIGYASVINCNPRFLETKTFQFFYKKSIGDAVHTVAHELLHFIFFDFIEKKLQKEIKHLTEDQIWDCSEIFNILALKSSRYRHIIDQRHVVPYPDHRHHVSKLQKMCPEPDNAAELVEKVMAVMETKK